jgi:hypothetical protein
MGVHTGDGITGEVINCKSASFTQNIHPERESTSHEDVHGFLLGVQIHIRITVNQLKGGVVEGEERRRGQEKTT